MAPKQEPRKNKPGAGRPGPPAYIEGRAVELARETGSSVEAARRLTVEGYPVDASRVRAWVRAAKAEAPPASAAPPAPRAAGVPDPDAERAAGADGVVPPPPGLTARETRLWIVDQEIGATRKQLARARLDGAINTASLQGELRKLLDDRDELSPKEAADPQAEERRWREEAGRVRARIEAGCRAFEEG